MAEAKDCKSEGLDRLDQAQGLSLSIWFFGPNQQIVPGRLKRSEGETVALGAS